MGSLELCCFVVMINVLLQQATYAFSSTSWNDSFFLTAKVVGEPKWQMGKDLSFIWSEGLD